MQHKPVQLENLTDDEKKIVIEAARKNMMRGTGIFLVPFFVLGFVLFYINNHYMGLGLKDENLRSFLNVTLAILTVLSARLFVNTVLRLRKAQAAWQKKVFRGKITSKNGNHVTIANQSIKLTAGLAEKIKEGDDVVIAVNMSDNYPLSAEVIAQPHVL